MDPNATVGSIRMLTIAILAAVDSGAIVHADAAIELAEHCEALDGWLSRGGFLPTEWAR